MKYRAITGENFYFNEMRSLCNFILKNDITEETLKEKLMENDVLDCKSMSNFNKKYHTVNKRIKFLNRNLMKILVESNVEEGKFLNLYTILCSERFIAEFMEEVVKNKYKSYEYYLNEGDFNNFLQYKEEQSEIVNGWTNAGKKKMLVKIKNFLLEGGFIKKESEKVYKIFKPVIDKAILENIKENGEEKILKIMLY